MGNKHGVGAYPSRLASLAPQVEVLFKLDRKDSRRGLRDSDNRSTRQDLWVQD